MNDRRRRRFESARISSMIGSVTPRLVVGLLIVFLGVLSLVSSLQIADFYSPMRYFWPALFLAIGVATLIERRNERAWQWAVAWMIAGLWAFAYLQHWVDVGFWQVIMPLGMLALGAYLVRNALTQRSEQLNPSNSSSVVHAVGVLSSSEQKPTSLERADLFALMGGVKLDLVGTQLVNNAASVHVTACMGGIEICVPSEWVVVNRVLPIMGAFVDKRRPASILPTADTTKTLTIDGFVLMGGIEVKN
jgi:predicted membrane protein